MNEVIIDDKKYVSSKQAAELTGYAKDYVGQLCREGRVPARLIGRSWYVLASAIQDHRFGTIDEKKQLEEKPKQEMVVISKTWQAPKYEAETHSHFPSINKLSASSIREEKVKEIEDASPDRNSIQMMHEAWKDWFTSKPVQDEPAVSPEVEAEIPVETAFDSPEIKIPIRSLEEAPRNRAEKQVQPISEAEEVKAYERPQEEQIRRPNRLIQTILVLITVSSLCYGFIALGYADEIISSQTLIAEITGLSVINNQ